MRKIGIQFVAAFVCVIAIVFAVPGAASAAGSSDFGFGSGSGSIGGSDPDRVHLTADGRGGRLDYTVTNVPKPPGRLTPRACNTVAIVAVPAVLAVLPSLFDYLSTGSISFNDLVARIRQNGALAGVDLLKGADDNGVVMGSFDVRAGFYAVASVCNISPTSPIGSLDRSLIGVAFAVVGPGFGSGS